MNTRRYRTAYTLAKSMEIISWIILIAGVIAGIVLIADDNVFLGVVVAMSSVVFGLILVFFAQLTLIFIDIENNTHQLSDELNTTNAMLAETLGTIAVNVRSLVEKRE